MKNGLITVCINKLYEVNRQFHYFTFIGIFDTISIALCNSIQRIIRIRRRRVNEVQVHVGSGAQVTQGRRRSSIKIYIRVNKCYLIQRLCKTLILYYVVYTVDVLSTFWIMVVRNYTLWMSPFVVNYLSWNLDVMSIFLIAK